MTVEEAIQFTMERFPFSDYMHTGNGKAHEAYSSIANTVLSHLKAGSTILDFGSGPCDKTAILQFMGFRCSACDDLQDNWHKSSKNKEAIISFADKCRINFYQYIGGDLPFEKNSFDMVMLHDVLEHLHDSPRLLLNNLIELIKPDGLLFVTVPNAVNIRKRVDVIMGKTNLPSFEDYYWYPGSWRGHIREYVRNDLVLLSKYLDLQILELRSCDHMLQKLPNRFIRTVYLLFTRFFEGWKDSWLLIARKKQDWTSKFLSE